MSTYSQGFLPYGSNDPSVVIQLPLTSPPVQGPLCPYSSIALPGSSIGTPQFDPVKGMRCANFPDNNAVGFQAGYVMTSCTLSTAVMTSLTFQGQISFEVEAAAVCYDTASHLNAGNQPHFSSGYVVPAGYGQGGGNSMCFMYLGGPSLTEAIQPFKPNGSGQFDLLVNPGNVTTGGQGYWKREHILTTVDSPNTGMCSFTETSPTSQFNNLKTVATGGPTAQIHSYGKSQFIKVNIYWQGNWVTAAIDGLDWITIRRTGPSYPVTDLFPGYLSLGCAGSGNNALSFYMRNFQMSTAAPYFATKPKFSRIHIIGDSTNPVDYSDRSVQFVGSGGGDTARPSVIRRAFQQLGYYVEVFGSQLVGYTIDDDQGTITGITQAASAVVTITNTSSSTNPYPVNAPLIFSGVVGMTQINGLIGVVSASSGSNGTWTVTVNINSSAFTAYSSGGTVIAATCMGGYRDTITPKSLAAGFYQFTGSPPPSGMPWPDVVGVCGAINDFASDATGVGDTMQNPPVFLQDSRFYASLKRLINYYLWGQYTSSVVTGGTRTPVSHVVVMTPMSPRWKGNQPLGWGTGSPVNAPGHGYFGFQYLLNAIRNAPTWWNTSYPSFPNLVSVADYYTFLGGDNYLFGGSIAGSGNIAPPFISGDGVHPLGPQGEFAMGTCLAQEFLRVFSLS